LSLVVYIVDIGLENGLGLDQGLGFSCTQSPGPDIFWHSWGFPWSGGSLDYRHMIRPRSINQTQNLGTGSGFSKIAISIRDHAINTRFSGFFFRRTVQAGHWTKSH